MSAQPIAFPSLVLTPPPPRRPGIARRDLDNDMAELERAQLSDAPKEESMPRGIYDRSKAKPRAKKVSSAERAPAGAPKTAPKERKVKRAKARRAKPAAPSAPQRADSAVRFSVDDEGGVAIADGDTRIELVPIDASRLVAFLQKYAA